MIVGAILERSGLCKRVVHLEQSVSSSQSTRRGRMQWDAAAIDIMEIVDDAESPGPAEIVEVRSHSNSIEVVSDEESLGAPIMRSGSNKASAKDSRSHKLDKARTVRRALLKERKRQQAEMKPRVMSESNSSLQRKMWQCAWPKLEKPEGLDSRGRMSHGDVAKLLAIRRDDVREYRAIVAWAALQQQSDHLNELLRKHGAWVHRQSECGQTLAQAIAICSDGHWTQIPFRSSLSASSFSAVPFPQVSFPQFHFRRWVPFPQVLFREFPFRSSLSTVPFPRVSFPQFQFHRLKLWGMGPLPEGQSKLEGAD